MLSVENLPRACGGCRNLPMCEMAGNPQLRNEFLGQPSRYTLKEDETRRRYSTNCFCQICNYAQKEALKAQREYVPRWWDKLLSLLPDWLGGKYAYLIPITTKQNPHAPGVGRFVHYLTGDIVLFHPQKGRVKVCNTAFVES